MIGLHQILLTLLLSHFIPPPTPSDGYPSYHVEIHCNQELDNAYRNLRWNLPRHILRLKIMLRDNIPENTRNRLDTCHSDLLRRAGDVAARKAQDSCPFYRYTTRR